MRKLFHSCGLVVLACFVLTVFGCSSAGDRQTAPVSGKVTYQGKSLTHGTVMFMPEAGGPAAQGEIGSDGTFKLGTYSTADGAVLGKHKVAITALEDAGGGLPEARSATPDPIIPKKYLDQDKSGLSFEVKDEDNVANFELTD